jgi:hypothetical protein
MRGITKPQFLLLISVTFMVGVLALFYSLHVPTNVKQAAASTSGNKSLTAQADWEAGTLSNVDTTSSVGSFKISKNIINGLFSLATDSDINGGAGHVVFGSDGSYLYAVMGNPPQQDPAVVQNYRYNPVTNAWSQIADRSINRALTCGAGVNGKFYVLGGKGLFSTYYKDVEMYDSGSNSWVGEASSLYIHYQGSCIGYNDKIYAFGGAVQSSEVYDTTLGSWSSLASMPVLLNAANVSYLDGAFYLYRDSVALKYTIATNSWTTLAAVPFVAVTSSALDSKLYVMSSINEMYQYNPDTDTYTSLHLVNDGQAPPAYLPTNSATIGSYIYIYMVMASPPIPLYRFPSSSSYFAQATQTSGVSQLDAGVHSSVNWGALTATVDMPAGTAISFRFRTSPDSSTWSAWSASTPYSASVSLAGLTQQRYLQVETKLTSSGGGASTPRVDDYSANYQYDDAPVPTCSDGIQNQDETGVDCGGSCGACPVTPPAPTCSDGIKNGDETGVDSGGSCAPVVAPLAPLCQNGELAACLANVDTRYQECLRAAGNDPLQAESCYSIPCAEESACYTSCGQAGADQTEALRTITPNGGEVYTTGGKMEIDWDYYQNKKKVVNNSYEIKVSISTDSGKNYKPILNLLPAGRAIGRTSDGSVYDNYQVKDKNGNTLSSIDSPEAQAGYLSYSWLIPADASLASNQVRIKLESVSSCSPVTPDESDADFTINRPVEVKALIVNITPAITNLFTGDKTTFTAQAYYDGADVTTATTFQYSLKAGGQISEHKANQVVFRAGSAPGKFPGTLAVTANYQGIVTGVVAGVNIFPRVVNPGAPNCTICDIVNQITSNVKGSSASASSALSLALATLLSVAALGLSFALNAISLGGRTNFFGLFVKGLDKKKAKGLIYDAFSGLGIPFAKVILINEEKKMVVGVVTSDKNGRFALPLKPGQRYLVKVEMKNYQIFQRKEQSPFLEYELKYSNNYLGEGYTAGNDDYFFNKNIPLVPDPSARNLAKRIKFITEITRILTEINVWIVAFGFGLSLVAFFFDDRLYNRVVLVLYLAIIAYSLINHFFYSTRSFGSVYNSSDSGKPVQLAIVRAVRVKYNKPVRTVVTDENGHFALTLPKGYYKLDVSHFNLRQIKNTEIVVKDSFHPRTEKIMMTEIDPDPKPAVDPAGQQQAETRFRRDGSGFTVN